MSARCKIFYDCEFLEGSRKNKVFGINIPFSKSKPTIDLISIGMVTEIGDTYYAVSKEFDVDAAWEDQWIQDNVLLPIFEKFVGMFDIETPFTKSEFKTILSQYGQSREDIRNEVIAFVRQYQDRLNTAYDHVVLCWLFGSMMDLPHGFPMYTTDLQQMFDDINAKIPEGNLKSYPDYPKNAKEHDALADAFWNFELFKFLQNHNN
jgi:hypothetical protein